MHPETTVLSLETGFERDYREGAAYRGYFSTQRLMFEVPETDDRLKNKQEVLVMRLPPPDGGDGSVPVAIAADFLETNRLFQQTLGGHPLVVVTSREGANRVYRADEIEFSKLHEDGRLEDGTGRLWQITEDALAAVDDPTLRLERVSAQRAFWFGWYAQFPNTVLVKR